MHNGTIHNYQELAKKYIPKIDITGMTDSQVMARIFYYAGYTVLSEYNGSAVFAIADYRNKKPKVLLFKGASKKDKLDKKETEERPLYFCINPIKGELVFSSIAPYLFSLRHEFTIWSLNSNCILEFDGKNLVAVEEISRAKVTQNKEMPTVVSQNYYKEFGLYNNGNGFLYDDYISINQFDNTYYSRGIKAHGRIILSKWGMIMHNLEKSHCREVYFWNGIALRNIACFRFISDLKKKSGLDDKEFNVKFNNTIRYLSVDGIYREGNIWYQATSPIKRILFTGTLNMLTSTVSTEFFAGNRKISLYGRSTENAFATLDSVKLGINFKTIKKECESLMK